MNIIFTPYSDSYFEEINNTLVPNAYLLKYSNQKIIYKILSFLKLYQNFFYVLLVDHFPVGTILIRRRLSNYSFKKNWWIYGVYIRESYRGKGLGEEITIKAIDWIRNNKAESVLLYVDKHNTTAISLYVKLGFIEIKKSKIHKINKNQLLLKKVL